MSSSTSRCLCFFVFSSVSLLFNQKLGPKSPAGRMWPHFGCFLSSACFSQELGSFSKREMSNCLWLLGKKLFEDTFTGWSLLVRAPAALCDSVSCPLCAIAPPPLIVHLQDIPLWLSAYGVHSRKCNLYFVQNTDKISPPPDRPLARSSPMVVHLCILHSEKCKVRAKWYKLHCHSHCAVCYTLWARSLSHDSALEFSCHFQPDPNKLKKRIFHFSEARHMKWNIDQTTAGYIQGYQYFVLVLSGLGLGLVG